MRATKPAVVGFIIGLLFVTNFAQSNSTLSQLAWLSGCWEGRQGEAVIEMHWSKPDGAMMLGFNRIIRDNRTTSFEFLQIREDATGLVYVTEPQGLPRPGFKLVESTADRFVFENTTPVPPHRLVYERQGLMLLAAMENGTKDRSNRIEFLLKRVRCNEAAAK